MMIEAQAKVQHATEISNSHVGGSFPNAAGGEGEERGEETFFADRQQSKMHPAFSDCVEVGASIKKIY